MHMWMPLFGSFIPPYSVHSIPHPLDHSNPSPPEQLLQGRAKDPSPLALVAASPSVFLGCFLFSYEDSLEMLLFLSFLPPTHLLLGRSPTGYCGNRAAWSRLFSVISLFEADITHSFIKHLRIWYGLRHNNGIKSSKRIGPGLENIKIFWENLDIKNNVPKTPKALFQTKKQRW